MREVGVGLVEPGGHPVGEPEPESADDRERLLALEHRYARVEPHWRLGRYLLYTLERRTREGPGSATKEITP